jgi:hypothetical protein
MILLLCGMIEQVCLDYWNSLVLELFEAHHNLENPAVATANMMGLQVSNICSDDFFYPFGIGRTTFLKLHLSFSYNTCSVFTNFLCVDLLFSTMGPLFCLIVSLSFRF